MKDFNLIFLFILSGQLFLLSQGCLPEGIAFKTQESIDNFQTNYTNCTIIEGDVSIGDEWGSIQLLVREDQFLCFTNTNNKLKI